MRTYVNINKLVAIGVIAVTSVGAYLLYKNSKKEDENVTAYKNDHLDASIDEMIDKATIENTNIADASERATAKEVLYSLKNECVNAQSIAAFDIKIQELKGVSERLTSCSDPIAISSTIKFYKNRLDARAYEDCQKKENAADIEKLKTFMTGVKEIVRTVGIYS